GHKFAAGEQVTMCNITLLATITNFDAVSFDISKYAKCCQMGHKFAAGDEVTIANITLLATITNFDAVSFDISKYANVARWYEEYKKVVQVIKRIWKIVCVIRST
ncbi:hypothetical protein DOY81_012242, partial [Sarcophaga bullata]